MSRVFTPNFGLVLFWGGGVALLLFALLLLYGAPAFSYDYLVREMPIAMLVAGLMGAGLVFLLLRYTIAAQPAQQNRSLSFMIALLGIGLAARLILLGSEPVLEDDYQRYLWDGAVMAYGLNPYAFSPQAVLAGNAPLAYQDLAVVSGLTLERVNHPELRTVYPLGAEVIFGLVSKISPFSLLAWRGVLLLAELCSCALLLLLCRHFGRDPIWLCLYWWNPLVIKEVMNSAHMEGVLMPFVLLGLYLSVKSRFVLASMALTFAASIKLWPALLLPLIWRRLWTHKTWLLFSFLFAVIVGGGVLWAFVASGLNDSSGLVAYGQRWKTNSAFFPLFEQTVFGFFNLVTPWGEHAPFVARGLIGVGLCGAVIYFCLQPLKGQRQILTQFFLVCLLMFLVSPAQFPWYCLWVMPFMVFFPLWGLALLVPMMALYYLGFALMTAGIFESYRLALALVLWLPIWVVLWFEARKAWRERHET